MFQRKNQDILSEHYNKVVQRPDGQPGALLDGAVDGPGEDDFLTVKRANHALDDDEEGNDENVADNISKRKLKAGTSKKAAAAQRGQGEKLTFDDEGEAHALYEMQTEEDFAKAGSAAQQSQQFLEKQRAALQEQDVGDRERQRDRKREKKRKRKEAEAIMEEQPLVTIKKPRGEMDSD